MQQKGWLGGTDGAGTEAALLHLPSHLHQQDSEPQNRLTDTFIMLAALSRHIKQQHDLLKPVSLLILFLCLWRSKTIILIFLCTVIHFLLVGLLSC